MTFRRYTGPQDDDERREVIADPPDILLANYVRAELILTRVHEKGLVRAAQGLQYLVLDELHTYRGWPAAAAQPRRLSADRRMRRPGGARPKRR